MQRTQTTYFAAWVQSLYILEIYSYFSLWSSIRRIFARQFSDEVKQFYSVLRWRKCNIFLNHCYQVFSRRYSNCVAVTIFSTTSTIASIHWAKIIAKHHLPVKKPIGTCKRLTIQPNYGCQFIFTLTLEHLTSCTSLALSYEMRAKVQMCHDHYCSGDGVTSVDAANKI